MGHDINSHVIECKWFNDKIALRGESMAPFQDAASPYLVWQQSQNGGAYGDGVGHACLIQFLLVAT